MEHNSQQDLWQGGPWEQPSHVFPAPPAVRIPTGSRPTQRPSLSTRRRRPRWPWLVGVVVLVLAFWS